MTRFRTYLLSSLIAGALGFAPACGDEDEEPGEAALEGDCKTISDACHHADEGEGEAHDCHELAHENDVDACSDQLDSCMAACDEHGH